MKRLIPLLALLIAASCTPPKIIERSFEGETNLRFLDFQSYIDKDFLFSTSGINQDYFPIGMAYYTITPEIVHVYKETLGVVNEAMIQRGTGIIEDGVEYVICDKVPRQSKNVDDILAMAYEFAVSRGANGFINLKYDVDSDEIIHFSGMLIRI